MPRVSSREPDFARTAAPDRCGICGIRAESKPGQPCARCTELYQITPLAEANRKAAASEARSHAAALVAPRSPPAPRSTPKPVPVPELTGDQVRKLRESKGWAKARLALETGLAYQTITNVETGRHTISPQTQRRLAKAFQLSAS